MMRSHTPPVSIEISMFILRVIDYYNQKILELKDGGHYNAAAALAYNRDHLCAPSVDAKWGIKRQESYDY